MLATSWTAGYSMRRSPAGARAEDFPTYKSVKAIRTKKKRTMQGHHTVWMQSPRKSPTISDALVIEAYEMGYLLRLRPQCCSLLASLACRDVSCPSPVILCSTVGYCRECM